MKPHSDIAVVILNYNGLEHTRECLDSLNKSSYKPHSIIVVDNASTDDSVKNLRRILQKGELIELSVNGGYSYGNNIGIDRAFRNGAQYVFVINNDIIVDQNCIKLLHHAISNDKKIGIIGPKVLYYSKPDTINYAGITGYIHKASYTRIGLNEKDNAQYEELIDTLYQDGSAFLISKSCFDRVGGFDERLWAYSEESDLCERARSAGFRICCLQNAKIWHKVSATFGSYYYSKPLAIYYGIRNNYIFHRRYAGSWAKRVWVVFILLSRTPRHLASIIFKRKIFKIKNLCMLIAATLVGITTNSRQPSDAFAPIKVVKRESRITL